MLSLSFIREHPQQIIDRLRVKNFDASEIVNSILELDQQRRETQTHLEEMQARSNTLAKEIGVLYKSGKGDEANEIKKETGALKGSIREAEKQLDHLLAELDKLTVALPNLPHESVASGKGEDDNEVIEEGGQMPSFPEEPLPHWTLVEQYDLIDFGLGNKISGAGFPLYTGQGARLQRALINYFLDEAIKAGYQEVQPPYLVNPASAYGTGQLPDKDGQMYAVPEDGLYLIPTAEVPVTNIYRDVILQPEELPKKHVAYSACFRREAGSYGKDVRGLNRLHQFDKVEIVQITSPQASYETLEEMRRYVTHLIQQLGLPYRVLRLCGGDISFTSALTYDMEVWSAAQKRWLEVSSVSNFEAFQSTRMKCRIKETSGKTVPAHTLNGSALALPRILAAILENNQTPDGIRVPDVLVPYTGFAKVNQ